jgi:hypothetical protein
MDAVPGLTDPPSPPQPLDAGGAVSVFPAPAGAVPGGGTVTPAGEYRYRIPIEVPPGRAGIAPSLALVYSSRGKNGHLGVGWQIEGLSEITRCPRTFAVDRVSDGVRLDDHDALCLDGHALVGLGPGKLDGCGGEEYRTEDDTFARILSCGRGNAIRWFRVYTKDGRIHDYTPIAIPSASMSAPTAPGDNPPGGTVNFTWPLAVDRDRAGNAIHYQYGTAIQPFGGNVPPAVEYYPTEIDYTFQDTTQEQGLRSIRFDYLPAGSQRPDPSFSYVAGVRVNVTQRLAAIEAWAPNPYAPASKVWEYDLTYETSPGSGASLLTKVQRCDKTGTCLPAKRFGWTSSAGPAYAQIHEKHAGMTGKPLVLDLDGDGRDDVLFTDLNRNVRALSTADPAAPLRVETLLPDVSDLATSRPIDLDGDGRDELVVPHDNTRYDVLRLSSTLHALSASMATAHVEVPGADVASRTPALFADLDGDGLPDLLEGGQQTDTVWSWAYRLNEGGMTFHPAVALNPGGLTVTPLPGDGEPTSFAADQGQRRATLYFGEYQETWGQEVLGEVLVGVLLDTAGHPQLVTGGAPGGLSAFADLNGDGLHETILAKVDAQHAFVAIGVVGDNWPSDPALGSIVIPWDAPGPLDATKVSLLVADLDGDGRDDVLVSYRGTPAGAVRVWLDASGELEQAPLDAPPPDAVGDFDGDGLLDLLVWEGSSNGDLNDPSASSNAWTVYRRRDGGRGRDVLHPLLHGAGARPRASCAERLQAPRALHAARLLGGARARRLPGRRGERANAGIPASRLRLRRRALRCAGPRLPRLRRRAALGARARGGDGDLVRPRDPPRQHLPRRGAAEEGPPRRAPAGAGRARARRADRLQLRDRGYEREEDVVRAPVGVDVVRVGAGGHRRF